jgi:Zn-dependent protease
MELLRWLIPFFQGLLVGLVAMAIHEMGHLIAAPLVGIKVRTVGLGWKGIYTLREPGPPAKNIIVSLAGPLTNVLFLAFWHLSPKLGLANLCFAFFNVLPIEGSDGERVWKCWRQIKRERANRTQFSQTVETEKSRPPAKDISQISSENPTSRSERLA